MADRLATAFTGHWRKSTYSNDQAGSCVEILDGHPAGIPVRDSKVPSGPALLVTRNGWAPFVRAVKDGGFPA